MKRFRAGQKERRPAVSARRSPLRLSAFTVGVFARRRKVGEKSLWEVNERVRATGKPEQATKSTFHRNRGVSSLILRQWATPVHRFDGWIRFCLWISPISGFPPSWFSDNLISSLSSSLSVSDRQRFITGHSGGRLWVHTRAGRFKHESHKQEQSCSFFFAS